MLLILQSVSLLVSSSSDDSSNSPSERIINCSTMYSTPLVNYLLPNSDLLPSFISFLLLTTVRLVKLVASAVFLLYFNRVATFCFLLCCSK